VTLTQPFLFCRTEVPLHVWDAVPGFGGTERMSLPDPNDPVLDVSCDAADSWCSTVELEVPSEAEWEYGARGSAVGHYFYSADDRHDSYKYVPRPTEPRLGYVGASTLFMRSGATAFGVLGACDGRYPEVPEWTSDYDGRYPTGAVVDPRITTGRHRVFRDPRVLNDGGGGFPVWKRGSRSWEWLLKNYVGVRPIRRLFIRPM
jgi:formylglycine-generating enzyme required for sulfatase activity